MSPGLGGAEAPPARVGWGRGCAGSGIGHVGHRVVHSDTYPAHARDNPAACTIVDCHNYGHGADARYDSWVILQQKS